MAEPNILTSTSRVEVPEGGKATFNVRLSARPAERRTIVRIRRINGDGDVSLASKSRLRFTRRNYRRWQTVTLQAAQDGDTAPGEALFRLSGEDVQATEITAVEVENDFPVPEPPLIVTSTSSVQVPEGGSASFNVKLSARPLEDTATIGITRISGDADIALASAGTLTFSASAYNQWQTVTLKAAEDGDTTNGQALFRLAGDHLAALDVVATEIDNDEEPPVYQIQTDVSRLTVVEGGTASFRVRLSADPRNTVRLTVGHAGGDADIAVSAGGTIYFNSTNWDSYQPVTLAAAEDPDGDNGTARFALAVDGAETVQVTAVEVDAGGGASGRVVIDPVSRIEGHLRVEVSVSNGAVEKAWSSATLFRGIERILQGRDPHDAPLITQRLCGVCTYVHQLCSVRAIEDAAGIVIPENARVVRNLILGAQFMHDHIVHFYHLHGLDWADITKALAADPAATAQLAATISPQADPIDFAAVQHRLQQLVNTGNLGPFANAYWGHADYRLTPEENLLVTAHYLSALEIQVTAAKMMAILGGKNPHPQSVIVGGVTCGGELTPQRLATFRDYLAQTQRFIETVYLPDLKAVAAKYMDWTAVGGFSNFLACGEFPQSVDELDLFMPRGVILNGDLFNVQPLDEAHISEHVAHSWYAGDGELHPLSGHTEPAFTGLDVDNRYSWFKAPRYDGAAMEVGCLARVLVGYGMGKPEFVDAVQAFLTDTNLTEADLLSTVGRTAARAIETALIGNAMFDWLDELNGNLESGDKEIYTGYELGTGYGRGLLEAPRGALGHWIDMQDKTTQRYQMVVPTTWNLGPRCANRIAGPMEKALVGVPVVDPENPVEVLRVIHSFDPCVACGVHVIDKDRNKAYTVKVI
ncbi:MAG: nickel-dependent hydrogenase large subunit [Desulfosarcinaceae bacterium]|nr:nickel-dependent hydrogenase large subunit [Desulfosarcinaceae bacterium]